MTCGIYKITCNETGKCYIGQSKNIEKRWKMHYHRFNKEYFTYEILMSCVVDWLDFFEKAFISGYDSHRNGFNKTIGGTSIKMKYPSEETRRKMSEASKGKKYSDEAKRKMSEAKKNMSDETKRKMSEAKKGIKHSEETIKKMSEAHKNISDETRHKLSQAAKNRSDETRRKISEARKSYWLKKKENI